MGGYLDVVLLKDFTDLLGRKYSSIDLYNQISKMKVLFGELGSGIGDKIALDKVSHQIKNIRFGNDLVGDVHFMDTPCGRLAIEMINSGTPWRTSIRTIGSVDAFNNVIDMKFVAFDLVFDMEKDNVQK